MEAGIVRPGAGIDAPSQTLHSSPMSTLQEIESAVQKLSRREQELLFQQLGKRLGGTPTCYDLSRELFEEPGRIGASGKTDLSTNKAHLANFGRKATRRSGK